jgi:hypothetical protein
MNFVLPCKKSLTIKLKRREAEMTTNLLNPEIGARKSYGPDQIAIVPSIAGTLESIRGNIKRLSTELLEQKRQLDVFSANLKDTADDIIRSLG